MRAALPGDPQLLHRRRWARWTERVAPHRAGASPALAALNMGSMNYAKYSPRSGRSSSSTSCSRTPSATSPSSSGVMKEARGEAGAGVLRRRAHQLHRAAARHGRCSKRPLQFSFIMGVLGGDPRHGGEPRAAGARRSPPDSTWEVIGISHEQWRMLARGAVAGRQRARRAGGQLLPGPHGRDGEARTASWWRRRCGWRATSAASPRRWRRRAKSFRSRESHGNRARRRSS